MKKIFTFALVALTASTVCAATAPWRLIQRIDQGWENHLYEWNDNNQLVKSIDEAEYDTYADYVYNDKGQLIRINDFQYFYTDQGFDNVTEDGFYSVASTTYEYDDQDRISVYTALNYEVGTTKIKDILDICGYVYEYNEDGKVAKRITCTKPSSDIDKPFDTSTAWQRVDYTYDEKGRLSLVEYVTESYYGDYISSVYYVYDALDRLVVEQFYDGETQTGNRAYIFDEVGNIEEIINTSASFRYKFDDDGMLEILNRGTVQQSLQYTYNTDVLASDCLFGLTEFDNVMENMYIRFYNAIYNQPVTEDVYRINEETLDLVLVSTIEYNWEDTAGIESIEGDTKAAFNAMLEGDVLNLNGNTGAARIYDINGRLMTTGTGNQINVAGLEKGMYIVSTNAGSAKFVR